MFADYHVHTEYSDDSVYTMEQVVKDAIAIKKGNANAFPARIKSNYWLAVHCDYSRIIK